MPELDQRSLQYVIWQNRATRFYLGSRLNCLSALHAPAAYCGFIAIELMLKATLVYHDRSFKATQFRHNIAKLSRALRNKVRNSGTIRIPAYFSHEGRFQTVTRYPTGGKGVIVSAWFLEDLDRTFVDLLLLTPFQHNSELKHLLKRPSGPERAALTRGNSQLRRLRAFLKVAGNVVSPGIGT